MVKVRHIESGKVRIWTPQEILNEINRDRCYTWVDYTQENWEDGWEDFVEGVDYELVVEEDEETSIENMAKSLAEELGWDADEEQLYGLFKSVEDYFKDE